MYICTHNIYMYIYIHIYTHNETITAIMMLYKIMKATVHSPVGDTDFFDIVA